MCVCVCVREREGERERERVCACVLCCLTCVRAGACVPRVCMCVILVCALDWEGSWVFASTALAVRRPCTIVRLVSDYHLTGFRELLSTTPCRCHTDLKNLSLTRSLLHHPLCHVPSVQCQNDCIPGARVIIPQMMKPQHFSMDK